MVPSFQSHLATRNSCLFDFNSNKCLSGQCHSLLLVNMDKGADFVVSLVYLCGPNSLLVTLHWECVVSLSFTVFLCRY